MYFLDRTDFDCNNVPSDWGIYSKPMLGLIQNFGLCFGRWYRENSAILVGTPCELQVTALYDTLVIQYTSVISNFNLLMTSLSTGPFDIATYNNYIESYDLMMSMSSEITVLINNKCSFNVIDSTVGVDTICITCDDNKLNKCVGVYMEQIDIGSSFYGTITSSVNKITEDSYTGDTNNNTTF